jgi:hypothetical protein
MADIDTDSGLHLNLRVTGKYYHKPSWPNKVRAITLSPFIPLPLKGKGEVILRGG